MSIRYLSSTNAENLPRTDKKYKKWRQNKKFTPNLYYALIITKINNMLISVLENIDINSIVHIEFNMPIADQYKLFAKFPHLEKYIPIKDLRKYVITQEDTNREIVFNDDDKRINYEYVLTSFEINYLRKSNIIIGDYSRSIRNKPICTTDIINLYNELNIIIPSVHISYLDDTFCNPEVKKLPTTFMFNKMTDLQLSFIVNYQVKILFIPEKFNDMQSYYIIKTLESHKLSIMFDQKKMYGVFKLNIETDEDLFYLKSYVISMLPTYGLEFYCNLQCLAQVLELYKSKRLTGCKILGVDEPAIDKYVEYYHNKTPKTLIDIVTAEGDAINDNGVIIPFGNKHLIILISSIILKRNSVELSKIESLLTLQMRIKNYFYRYYEHCKSFPLNPGEKIIISAMHTKIKTTAHENKFRKLCEKFDNSFGELPEFVI